MKPIQHLVSVSGGKDSTAVYLRAIESGRPFRAVFADTGNEHELTYEYVARLHERTGGPKVEVVKADFTAQLAQHREYIIKEWTPELMAGRPGSWKWRPRKMTMEEEASATDEEQVLGLGPRYAAPEPDGYPIGNVYDVYRIPVSDPNGSWTWSAGYPPMSMAEAAEVVLGAVDLHQPSGNPYLDLCVLKSRFPSRMAQFCTQELKELPINAQVVAPMLRNGPVLQWLGIRAEESANRAKQPRFNHHESGSMLWRPIFEWSVADVWAMHRRHGLAPNPLYARGMTRVGCMPCINCRKNELRSIAAQFPSHIDRIERWEAIVARASKRQSATFFAAGTDPTDTDRPGQFSGIRALIEWSKTGRGGRQYAMFFDQQAGGGCSSDLGLCERSAA